MKLDETITTLEYGIWDKINLCFWVMATLFGSGINSLIHFNVRTVFCIFFPLLYCNNDDLSRV